MSLSGDEEMELFGESSVVPAFQPEEELLPLAPREAVEYPVATIGRFPYLSAESRLIKLPKSALSINFSGSAEKKAANAIQCRVTPEGVTESNARLVEWEDGSWTLAVGSEHFRIIERSEDVALFDKQDPLFIFIGTVQSQFNVIPGSLDSRTHKHVVEQTAVSRKLVESRKVTLAHGHSSTVNTIAVNMPNEPVSDSRGQRLTADFLEAGLPNRRKAPSGNSVRAIKASYRAAAPKRRKTDEEESPDEYEEEEDVEFDEPSGSVSDESVLSDSEESSDSSDSSDDSSSDSDSSSSSSSSE